MAEPNLNGLRVHAELDEDRRMRVAEIVVKPMSAQA
jgi:hypothetical protein